MKIEDYNKKIVLAFGFGGGGLYVREHYDEAVNSTETLKSVVNDLRSDIKIELSQDPNNIEDGHKELLDRVHPTNDEECIRFIDDYLGELKECYPELCGTVAGILFREGKLEETLKFLEVADTEEEIRWDS